MKECHLDFTLANLKPNCIHTHELNANVAFETDRFSGTMPTSIERRLSKPLLKRLYCTDLRTLHKSLCRLFLLVGRIWVLNTLRA